MGEPNDPRRGGMREREVPRTPPLLGVAIDIYDDQNAVVTVPAYFNDAVGPVEKRDDAHRHRRAQIEM